jgi:leader peptidase (prepilin peptidase)/N-methyltransferase
MDCFLGINILLLMACAALWDVKKRIIPNIVPALLLGIGFSSSFLPEQFYWSVPLSERIAGCTLPAATLLILHFLKKPVGGGDFKLSAALGFVLGLPRFALAYAVGGAIALIWALIRRQKSVPLAAFLAIGTLVCLLLQ